MHKSFQAQMKRGTLRNVSQPQALADAGREVIIGGGEIKPQPAKAKPKIAEAKPTEAKPTEAKPTGSKPIEGKAAAQPAAKRGAAKTAVVPASAPTPAPERPFYQRLFEAITPGPASASGGRT
jgi:cell division protein FtsN